LFCGEDRARNHDSGNHNEDEASFELQGKLLLFSWRQRAGRSSRPGDIAQSGDIRFKNARLR
jgi:hypothetical protein